MWVEIFCGLIIFKFLKWFFYDDDVLDLESSDFNALFSVANRYFTLLFLFFSGSVWLLRKCQTNKRVKISLNWKKKIFLFLILFRLISWISRKAVVQHFLCCIFSTPKQRLCLSDSIVLLFWANLKAWKALWWKGLCGASNSWCRLGFTTEYRHGSC